MSASPLNTDTKENAPMHSQYYPEDFEPAGFFQRNRWCAPAITTAFVAAVVMSVQAVFPALAALLPDGVLLMLFFSGSFLTWRAAFWTDTRSSRIVRWVAPALPLALMAAGAFLSSTTVIG